MATAPECSENHLPWPAALVPARPHVHSIQLSHRSFAGYEYISHLNCLLHDAPDRPQNGLAHSFPTECVSWARACEPDWLALALFAADAVFDSDACARAWLRSPR